MRLSLAGFNCFLKPLMCTIHDFFVKQEEPGFRRKLQWEESLSVRSPRHGVQTPKSIPFSTFSHFLYWELESKTKRPLLWDVYITYSRRLFYWCSFCTSKPFNFVSFAFGVRFYLKLAVYFIIRQRLALLSCTKRMWGHWQINPELLCYFKFAMNCWFGQLLLYFSLSTLCSL